MRADNKLNNPNAVIIIASVLVAIISYLGATEFTGLVRDFLVNISASVLMIAITVVLVDMSRERSLAKQCAEPKLIAIQGIIASNSALLYILAAKNSKKNPEILKSLLEKKDIGDNNLFKFSAKKERQAAMSLIELGAADILTHNNRSIHYLETIFNTIKEDYGEINYKYNFAFNNIAIKKDLFQLINGLDEIIKRFKLFEFGGQEIEKLLILADSEHPENPSTLDEAFGQPVILYLQLYVDFVSKYGNIDD